MQCENVTIVIKNLNFQLSQRTYFLFNNNSTTAPLTIKKKSQTHPF